MPRRALLALAFCLAAAPAVAQVRYVTRLSNKNRVGLTVTNYGFFGNNFTSRSPSFEFPLGSGYEHMSRAGLWVGAIALTDTGAVVGVSTALVDAAQGGASGDETEFTPLSDVISERSRLSNSRVYSRDAVSDQDLITSYADMPAKPSNGNQRERHTPLQITVRQTTYAFTLPAADAFVIARFVITNDGPPLKDAWLGLYSQFASGPKNLYSTWPPSASSGPGSWYYKAHIEYDAARRLFSERYCAGATYPAGCAASVVPPWAGLKMLGCTPGTVADRRVNWRWWTFALGDTSRDEDREKYHLMSDSLIDDPAGCGLAGTCSPIELMSVGPFSRIEHGDSVSVDFAFTAGDDQASLVRNADFAQFAHDIDYRLPAPPPSPRLLVETSSQAVDLWWDDSPESAVDPTSPAPGGHDFEGYRLYLGLDEQAPSLVAQYDLVDTTGFNTGLSDVVAPAPRNVDGILYRYHRHIGGLKDGFRYWGAITSFDTGDSQIGSLESGISQNKFLAVPAASNSDPRGVTVFPNPYRVETGWDVGKPARDHLLWFAGLPRHCTIRIYTLAGDRVYEKHFNGGDYRAENVSGVWTAQRNPDTGAPALSGGAFAWDMITDHGQAAATGLYLWTVEDLDQHHVERGKLLLVKSDRE